MALRAFASAPALWFSEHCEALRSAGKYTGGLYTAGARHSRRLHSSEAARPALMSRAAHAVGSKAVVRIEIAVSPRPCLGVGSCRANAGL
jgi:hypothetical protein